MNQIEREYCGKIESYSKGDSCREEEAAFRGTDCKGLEAGGSGGTGRGAGPGGGDFRAEVLAGKEAVRGAGDRSSPAAEAITGREPEAEEIVL